MMEINKFKDMWASKNAPEHLALQLNKEGIILQLVKLQKQTVFSSLFVSISFAFIFIILGIIWRKMIGQSLIFDIGATIVFIDMLIALAFIWSLVISWRGKNFSLDSSSFISVVLFRMQRRKFVLTTVLPFYILTLALGVNITYLYSLESLDLPIRIFIHLGITAALIIVMLLTLFQQKKHIQKKIDPLIKDLKEIRRNLLDDEV